MRLTPNMRAALRLLATGNRWRPPDIAGGQSTIRALVKRGLAERDNGRVRITDAGREVLR